MARPPWSGTNSSKLMSIHPQVPDIIIAVDGFSATGKSTFAKLVAERFSFLYLDSGALYRAVTLHALENGMIRDGVIDEPLLRQALSSLDVHFENINGRNLTFIGSRCVESEIRTMEVSGYVSPIAVIPFVRDFVDDRLHEAGKNGRVIMDGRDIGSAVFPNADLKIFMVADDQVRARRRFDEMAAKGQNPDFEEVLANLRERDYIDSHREKDPLTRPTDAYVIDNSDMTLQEEVVWLQGLIQGKFGILE